MSFGGRSRRRRTVLFRRCMELRCKRKMTWNWGACCCLWFFRCQLTRRLQMADNYLFSMQRINCLSFSRIKSHRLFPSYCTTVICQNLVTTLLLRNRFTRRGFLSRRNKVFNFLFYWFFAMGKLHKIIYDLEFWRHLRGLFRPFSGSKCTTIYVAIYGWCFPLFCSVFPF